jgi:hypothetical protein
MHPTGSSRFLRSHVGRIWDLTVRSLRRVALAPREKLLPRRGSGRCMRLGQDEVCGVAVRARRGSNGDSAASSRLDTCAPGDAHGEVRTAVREGAEQVAALQPLGDVAARADLHVMRS